MLEYFRTNSNLMQKYEDSGNNFEKYEILTFSNTFLIMSSHPLFLFCLRGTYRDGA